MTDPTPNDQGSEQKEEEWYERTRYQVLLFTVGIALFGLVLGLVLDWYIDPETSAQKKDLVQALGLITAGVAGAVGIFFTWRGQRLARQAQEENQRATLEQLEQSQAELDITRRGQITERFTRAIDQLGGESLEIRLGGIYSLERTAREDRDFHWPIMEVFTTYVRQHAPWQPNARRRQENEGGRPSRRQLQGDEGRPRPETWRQQRAPRQPETESTEEGSEEEVRVPEPDVQAILTVIGRRSESNMDVEYGIIDLRLTNLEGASLMRANLSGADLRGADLSYANLAEVNLRTSRGLTKEQLEQAKVDQTTQLPEGL